MVNNTLFSRISRLAADNYLKSASRRPGRKIRLSRRSN